MSVLQSFHFLALILAVESQNVTNRSFLVCVKSGKYAFLITLRLLGSMRQGEAKLCTLDYFSISSSPSVSPRQLCA